MARSWGWATLCVESLFLRKHLMRSRGCFIFVRVKGGAAVIFGFGFLFAIKRACAVCFIFSAAAFRSSVLLCWGCAWLSLLGEKKQRGLVILICTSLHAHPSPFLFAGGEITYATLRFRSPISRPAEDGRGKWEGWKGGGGE